MADHDDIVDSSSAEAGAITRCFTVYQLKPQSKPQVSDKNGSGGENDADQQTMGIDGAKNESVKHAGIYKMLMMVTKGLREKKKYKKSEKTI